MLTPSKTSPSAPLGDEVRVVLESKLFERSSILRILLIYLWEHQHEDVSEYAIAIDALQRKHDFDPTYDATVRVQLSRLRKRLKVFYATEGSALNNRIEIPLGTHKLKVVPADPSLPSTPPPNETTEEPFAAATHSRFHSRLLRALASLLFLIAIAGTIWRFWSTSAVGRSIARPQLAAFWKQEIGNARTTRIIVSAPTFFLWNSASQNQLLARDPDVNEYSRLDDSGRLTELKKRYGNPQLDQAFISAPDTFALMRLVRYFDSYGMQIPLYSESDSPASSNEHDNAIVLGNYRNMASYHVYTDKLSFQPDPRQIAIIDKNPAPGHPSRFGLVRESPTRSISPGLIAVLPGNSAGTHVILIVASFDTSSLVTFLTSDKGLRELQSVRGNAGNPPYFEAVVLSELNGEVLLNSWLAELKPYNPAR